MIFMNNLYNIVFIKIIKFHIYSKELSTNIIMNLNELFNNVKHLIVNNKNHYKESLKYIDFIEKNTKKAFRRCTKLNYIEINC